MAADPFVMRPAVPEDAAFFATRLRASDLAEVQATVGADVEDGLRRAIACSAICHVGLVDGVPSVILGCATVTEGGAPWLLGTDTLKRLPGALTGLGRRYVGLFLERWPVLSNYVDQRNAASVRWLTRLGFTILPPVEFGRNGELFHPFFLRA